MYRGEGRARCVFCGNRGAHPHTATLDKAEWKATHWCNSKAVKPHSFISQDCRCTYGLSEVYEMCYSICKIRNCFARYMFVYSPYTGPELT